MHRTVALLVPLAGWLLATAVTRAGEAETHPDPAQVEFFESKVRPVLLANCLGCHGPEKQKGGLRLDSRAAVLKGGNTGPVVAPGDPEGSVLVEAIGYESDTQMPPKGKLPDREIRALTEWVKMGAPWPESVAKSESVAAVDPAKPRPDQRNHWAFRPVATPAVPEVKDVGWPRGPVDHFVLARLEARGLRPVEPSDRRSLIRRASFDVTGLPPTPEEVEAFLADESPEAFARVVDRLLAAPQYGERWGRHWLDVARYGEDQAHTFQARMYPQGFMYRDWVVRALNNDMPYDRFVIEQIAGDLLDDPGRDARLPALGFFALGPVYYGNAIADERDDRIDTLSRGFLGLTVACARCHDHKFDPIPTRDYYALAGVFACTQYKEYPAAPKSVIEAYEKAQIPFKDKTAEIDTFLTLSNFRTYFALPKVRNQEDRWLPAESRPRLKELRAELDRLKKALPPPPPVVHGLADAGTVANLKVHIRGNPENLGEEAPRAFLSVLSEGDPAPFRQGSGRLELAREIASKDNPLTARVIVNRIWEHHFGRGLVATPSNFGTLGEPPSHPELLDYLASRFVALGWSMKALHREILLSQTYQLSSRIDPKNQEADPDNTLLWRTNRRRLEVEAWRDAMLAVSGNLDRTLGGPSQELTSPKNHRRTFYAAVSRHNLDSLLRLFDFPDPNITCDRRVVTAVPLQQLFVLNSEFMVEQARSLARRLTSDPDEPDEARVRRAFPLLYGRPAGDDEVRWGVEFLGLAGPLQATGGDRSAGGPALSAWEQYAQVLLGANEFTFLD
jgi:mono/diheme cytochrome c family protein